MRCALGFVHLWLLVVGCQAVRVGLAEVDGRLSARGSRSPSPPGHGGSSPPRHQPSSGLLGDVVAHATNRPATSAHSSQMQTHPAQLNQVQAHLARLSLSQGHHAHPGQPQAHPTQLSQVQAHLAHLSLSQAHAAHPGQMQGHPAHVGQVQAQLAHLSLTQAHPPQPNQSTRPGRGSSGPRYQPPEGGRLGHLLSTVRPEFKRVRKPTQRSKPGSSGEAWWQRPGGKPGQRASSGAREQWWKRPGGTPSRQAGTAPDYEQRVGYRNRLKLPKMLKSPPHLDEHPSGHQPHPHDKPPSPGSGSHAISKRRLGASE